MRHGVDSSSYVYKWTSLIFLSRLLNVQKK